MTAKKCTKTCNAHAKQCRRRLAKFPYLVSDDDKGNGRENVTIKMKSCFVKRDRYYSNLQGNFPVVELLETKFKFREGPLYHFAKCIHVKILGLFTRHA